MADRAENNKVPTRNAPNSDQEPQRSRGPDDRPTPPPRDEMNRKTAPGRDAAAPSSPDSAANRIRATESLFARTINDFCNKICHNRTQAPQQKSFDNVISAGKQCRRQFETERLSSLKIDEQLNFCGLLDRQTRRLFAL